MFVSLYVMCYLCVCDRVWSVGWIPEIMTGVRGYTDKEGEAAGCCEETCVSPTEDRGKERM